MERLAPSPEGDRITSATQSQQERADMTFSKDAEKQQDDDLEEESHGEDEEGEVSEDDSPSSNSNPDDAITPTPSAGGGVLSTVLSRVLTKASTKSFQPGPPPDGGLKAWTAGTSNQPSPFNNHY